MPYQRAVARVAVHRQVDQRHLDEVAVHHAVRQARLAARRPWSRAASRCWPAPFKVSAPQIVLAVLGEQRAQVVPQAELCVVGVGVLQVLDRADRLGALHLARQGVERRGVGVRRRAA